LADHGEGRLNNLLKKRKKKYVLFPRKNLTRNEFISDRADNNF